MIYGGVQHCSAAITSLATSLGERCTVQRRTQTQRVIRVTPQVFTHQIKSSSLEKFSHSLALTQLVSAERCLLHHSALRQTRGIKYLYVMHEQLCLVGIQPVPQRGPQLDFSLIQFVPPTRGQIAVAVSLFPAVLAEKNTSRLGVDLLPGRQVSSEHPGQMPSSTQVAPVDAWWTFRMFQLIRSSTSEE